MTGIDLDFKLISGSVSVLAWIPFKSLPNYLLQKETKLVFETKDKMGERVHNWNKVGQTRRRHIFCGSIKLSDDSLQKISNEEKDRFRRILINCSRNN